MVGGGLKTSPQPSAEGVQTRELSSADRLQVLFGFGYSDQIPNVGLEKVGISEEQFSF